MADKDLQVTGVVEIESKNIEIGDWGLTFTGQLTVEEWYNAVLSIQKVDGKIQWYLGDLAVYAESPTTGWGHSKYSDLIEATGYNYETMVNFANVARRFPAAQRKEMYGHVTGSLSFNHFRAVASLEDNFAMYWLEQAAKNGWGVAKLREKIHAWQTPADPDKLLGLETAKPQSPLKTFTGIGTWALGLAQSEGAELIRVQVIKNGKVLDEQTLDLEVE